MPKRRAAVPARCHGKQKRHCCSLCEEPGHRADTCPTALGKAWRKLRAQKSDAWGSGKTPRARKQQQRRKQTRQSYTGKSAKQRVPVLACRTKLAREREIAEDQQLALRELRRCRWLPKKAKACRNCGQRRWWPQVERQDRGLGLFRRCKGCHHWENVLVGTCFEGLRIHTGELYRLAVHYSRLPLSVAPSVLSLQKSCGGSRKQTQNFVNSVLAAEVREGRRRNSTLRLTGAVEGDAHRLRKAFVSEKNPHFRDLVRNARARRDQKGLFTPNKAVWAVHVRLAGLVVRGGQMALAELPLKVVAKHAAPPVESTLAKGQAIFLSFPILRSTKQALNPQHVVAQIVNPKP